MRLLSILISLAQGALWIQSSTAAPVASSQDVTMQAIRPPPTSCNTPTNRTCWLPGFDINTDWELNTPTTGVVRHYTFNITEVDSYTGPDGVVKTKAMLINGKFPGPTIKANWGDTIAVNVVNKLQTNGTGIHWHGMRQLNNNINDGVPGVTECPIPPGHNKTYTLTAMQYGTTWYHTHVSSQYAYGITGSIQIDGPAALNYDVDLGPFPISDWYYGSADQLLLAVSDGAHPFVPGQPGASPPSDNLLFNGTNIDPRGTGGGQYATVHLTPGKRHRLRLINPSVDNTFTVSIVNHRMTVIETDFVPVKPAVVDSLFLAVGQRYDVLLDADRGPPGSSFWINATFSNTKVCGLSSNQYPAAILRYGDAHASSAAQSAPPPGNVSNSSVPTSAQDASAPAATPPSADTSTSHDLPTDRGAPPADSLCADNTSFVPIVTRSAPLAQFAPRPDNSLPVSLQLDGATSRVYWQVNGSAIDVAWQKPTLQYLLEGSSSSSIDQIPPSSNIVQLPGGASQWSFWLIQSLSAVPHPMHLHGHDFLILGQSPPLANPADPANGPIAFNMIDHSMLRPDNPVRRDATMLPAWGWLLVAFETTNPGAWVFHCHIAWHISEGLSAQFLERPDDIRGAMDLNAVTDNCQNWRAYAPTSPFNQTDSGL